MSTRNLELMEKRVGPLGSGVGSLEINGKTYSLNELMKALGLITEGSVRPIDAFYLADEDVYAIRYLDVLARSIVVHEFGADFRYKREIRVHLAEIMGEDEYFDFPWSINCPWTL